MLQIFKYCHVIGLCLLVYTCYTRKKYAINNSVVENNGDTLVFTGCPEKIKAPLGSIIEIQLEAIPVLGYEWLVKDSSELLEEHKTDEIKYLSNDNENSFQLLHYKALKKGTEEINLEYKRTFEKEIKIKCNIFIEVY